MRLDEQVGDDDLVLQLGVLAGVARVLVRTEIEPWPAVEAAILDARDVVGREQIAELVALVRGAPELAGFGIHGEADGIADSGRVNAFTFPIGRELEDSRPALLDRIVVLVHVRLRADGQP